MAMQVGFVVIGWPAGANRGDESPPVVSSLQNIEYRIGEFKKLSDIGSGLNLLDYRISDSEKTIGCPPL
jgi:hypothetical protein